MNKRDFAEKLFLSGYNCAQSVCGAFYEEMGMSFEDAVKISSAFGGGMGRMREVCGALTGMYIVLGKIRGYDDPDEEEQKTYLYDLIQNSTDKIKNIYGTIYCRDLLNKQFDHITKADLRNEHFYEDRPCLSIVKDCAELTEKILNN